MSKHRNSVNAQIPDCFWHELDTMAVLGSIDSESINKQRSMVISSPPSKKLGTSEQEATPMVKAKGSAATKSEPSESGTPSI